MLGVKKAEGTAVERLATEQPPGTSQQRKGHRRDLEEKTQENVGPRSWKASAGGPAPTEENSKSGQETQGSNA